jgi:hypothetical protein
MAGGVRGARRPQRQAPSGLAAGRDVPGHPASREEVPGCARCRPRIRRWPIRPGTCCLDDLTHLAIRTHVRLDGKPVRKQFRLRRSVAPGRKLRLQNVTGLPYMRVSDRADEPDRGGYCRDGTRNSLAKRQQGTTLAMQRPRCPGASLGPVPPGQPGGHTGTSGGPAVPRLVAGATSGVGRYIR